MSLKGLTDEAARAIELLRERRAALISAAVTGQIDVRPETPKLEPVTEAGSGAVQDKEKVRLAAIIEKVNELFEGELSDDDQLVYVDRVIKTKLLESKTLVEQAHSNTKEQFATSPDIDSELLNAIMAALDAHTTMSTQALNSERVRSGLKDVLLNYAGLWEALRAKVA